MKLIREEDKIIIFLIKEYLLKRDININDCAETQLKKLFNEINQHYNLNLEGFYEVTVYLNNNYGIIIELLPDNDEYIKLYSNKLEMKITFKFDCDIYYSSEFGEYYYNYDFYSKNINYEGNILYGDKIKNLIKV